MPKAICSFCTAEYNWHPSQTKGKYCCRDCQITGTLAIKIQSGIYTRCNAYTYFKRTTVYECNECHVSDWNGKPLQLQIDHVDGNNKNNVVENLRYLCPNCHTQTETWGVRNVSEEGAARLKLAATVGNRIKNGKLPAGTTLAGYQIP